MANMADLLGAYGANPAALQQFDTARPELLPYATLLAARSKGGELAAVEAVYEWQDAPLLFLVNADALESQQHLHQIRRLLAMRGDAPYLGVVSPGRFEVYRLALDRCSLQKARVNLDDNVPSTILPQLGNVRPDIALSQRGRILLTGSISDLINKGKITHEDAISLAGRALFTRFLADRELLPDELCATKKPAELFDTRAVAENTSRWLDTTFNGDLLPLSANVFTALPASACAVLGNIMRRAPDGQLFLGWEEKWDNLDFSHIPVGVLSQVYERYLREHESVRQKKESGFYTPRPIADLMVRASFRALQRNNTACAAKVLDPAAGAGVFLLGAFRELVAARWRADGRQPDTKILRAILYHQIRGFDINEAALRFAALGLYLMSIELDPKPKPVDKLRFENLRGTVLHRLTSDGDEKGSQLGSLGPLVSEKHVGQYDLVIGNPPWKSATKLKDWKLVCDTVARIAASRIAINQQIFNPEPPLPNEVPDLPFIWRAMEWAKPGGQIAFALHARLLFQQGKGMPKARLALFKALDVSAIINATELRSTQVWPEISAPFCLLFATNDIPTASTGFRFINPRLEESFNAAGNMRIDALNAEIISPEQIAKNPDILKILFCGSKADLAIIERIRTQEHPTLESYWRKNVGMRNRRQLFGSGNGYQRLGESSRIRKNGDDLPGVDATYLHGWPELNLQSISNILIDCNQLGRFNQKRIHDPRPIDLFKAPMVVIHKSPPAEMERISIVVSENDMVFSKIFHGYSPSLHQESSVFVRYLALILGSKLAMWMVSITSGEFGLERPSIEKSILDKIPIPDFENITSKQREDAVQLFERLSIGAATWDDVDVWVAHLYKLREADLQIISDTLAFNLPFAENRQQAQQLPPLEEREKFCETLDAELTPWCRRFGTRLAIMPLRRLPGSPWDMIVLQTGAPQETETITESDWTGLLRAADDTASTEVLLPVSKTKLLIGKLAQRRYWSVTQARLLAQHIIWSHLDILKG